MFKVMTQAWRVLRVFTLAFVAQIVATGANVNDLKTQAIVAAAVAAGEATYRQVVPAKDQGFLTGLLAAYKQVTAKPKLTITAQTPAPKTETTS